MSQNRSKEATDEIVDAAIALVEADKQNKDPLKSRSGATFACAYKRLVSAVNHVLD